MLLPGWRSQKASFLPDKESLHLHNLKDNFSEKKEQVLPCDHPYPHIYIV